MPENKWEIKRLNERVNEANKRITQNERTIREHELFKVQTIEQLKTAFNRLKEIEHSNKWVSKTFFTLIFGGILTAVGSFINWALSR